MINQVEHPLSFTSFLIIIFFIAGCDNTQNSANPNKPNGDSIIEIDLSIPKPIESSSLPFHTPSASFMGLIEYMDSLNYKTDTSLVSRYGFGFDNSNITLYEGYPLYEIKYENHLIKRELKREEKAFKEHDIRMSMLLNHEYNPSIDSLFSISESIIAYGWALHLENKNYTPIGAVEEWKFSSEDDSNSAYNFLIEEYNPVGWPYFKIRPLYYVSKNYLYIFHARSTGFSYRNDKFLKWLEEHTSKDSH